MSATRHMANPPRDAASAHRSYLFARAHARRLRGIGRIPRRRTSRCFAGHSLLVDRNVAGRGDPARRGETWNTWPRGRTPGSGPTGTITPPLIQKTSRPCSGIRSSTVGAATRRNGKG
jgi:hypothetical protein